MASFVPLITHSLTLHRGRFLYLWTFPSRPASDRQFHHESDRATPRSSIRRKRYSSDYAVSTGLMASYDSPSHGEGSSPQTGQLQSTAQNNPSTPQRAAMDTTMLTLPQSTSMTAFEIVLASTPETILLSKQQRIDRYFQDVSPHEKAAQIEYLISTATDNAETELDAVSELWRYFVEKKLWQSQFRTKAEVQKDMDTKYGINRLLEAHKSAKMRRKNLTRKILANWKLEDSKAMVPVDIFPPHTSRNLLAGLAKLSTLCIHKDALTLFRQAIDYRLTLPSRPKQTVLMVTDVERILAHITGKSLIPDGSDDQAESRFEELSSIAESQEQVPSTPNSPLVPGRTQSYNPLVAPSTATATGPMSPSPAQVPSRPSTPQEPSSEPAQLTEAPRTPSRSQPVTPSPLTPLNWTGPRLPAEVPSRSRTPQEPSGESAPLANVPPMSITFSPSERSVSAASLVQAQMRSQPAPPDVLLATVNPALLTTTTTVSSQQQSTPSATPAPCVEPGPAIRPTPRPVSISSDSDESTDEDEDEDAEPPNNDNEAEPMDDVQATEPMNEVQAALPAGGAELTGAEDADPDEEQDAENADAEHADPDEMQAAEPFATAENADESGGQGAAPTDEIQAQPLANAGNADESEVQDAAPTDEFQAAQPLANTEDVGESEVQAAEPMDEIQAAQPLANAEDVDDEHADPDVEEEDAESGDDDEDDDEDENQDAEPMDRDDDHAHSGVNVEPGPARAARTSTAAEKNVCTKCSPFLHEDPRWPLQGHDQRTLIRAARDFNMTRSWFLLCRSHKRQLAAGLGLRNSGTDDVLQDRVVALIHAQDTKAFINLHPDWFLKRYRQVLAAAELCLFKYAFPARPPPPQIDPEALLTSLGCPGGAEILDSSGTLVVTGLFDYFLKDIMVNCAVKREFGMYRYHQAAPTVARQGFQRLMYYSGVQQAYRTDPMGYILSVATRPDHCWRLIAFPYVAKDTNKEEKTGFLHMDLNLDRFVETGYGGNLISGSLSLDDEDDEGCTVVVEGFHLQIHEWQRMLNAGGIKRSQGATTDCSSTVYTSEHRQIWGEPKPLPCKKGDVRMTLPSVIHGSTAVSHRRRRCIFSWHMGIKDDGETLELDDLPTVSELARCHRDRRIPRCQPNGAKLRHSAINEPFPPTTLISGVYPVGDALLGLRSWDDHEVLEERNVLLGPDRKAAMRHVRRVRELLREAYLQASLRVARLEAAMYGENSFNQWMTAGMGEEASYGRYGHATDGDEDGDEDGGEDGGEDGDEESPRTDEDVEMADV